MPDLNLQNIINSILKESELIINQSQHILLSGGDGLDGNNFFAGNLVENFISDLLERMLPDRFRVVTGYIMDHQNIVARSNLKQVDCIIVDKAYPIWYKFKDLDLYIVTKESVCGIIEIKRNLRNQLNNSITHISEILQQAGIVKNDNTPTLPFIRISPAPGNAIQSPYRANPIIGIIALESGYNNLQDFTAVSTAIEEAHSLIDFVWCVNGASLLTQRDGNITPGNVRATNNSWHNLNQLNEWNVNFRGVDGVPAEKIFMRVCGFIIAYLMRTTGKNGGDEYFNNYYFSNNIFNDPGQPPGN